MWRVARSAASGLSQPRRLMSTAIPGPCIVHKRGADILHDPWFNKVRRLLFLLAFILPAFLSVFFFPAFVGCRRDLIRLALPEPV